MNLLPGTYTTSTTAGVIGTSGHPIRIYSVHLKSGGSASTAIFISGKTAVGTSAFQVDGIANEGVTLNWAGGIRLNNGCYYAGDGNLGYLTVTYSEEF